MNNTLKKYSFLKLVILVLLVNLLCFGENALVCAEEITDSVAQTTQISNEQVVVQQKPVINGQGTELVQTEQTQEISIMGNEKQNIDKTIGEEQNAADSPAREQSAAPIVDSEEVDKSAEISLESKEEGKSAEFTIDSEEDKQLAKSTVESEEVDKPAKLTVDSQEIDKPVVKSNLPKVTFRPVRAGSVLKEELKGRGINWAVVTDPNGRQFTFDGIPMFSIDGQVAFCIEPGVEAGVGLVHDSKALDTIIKNKAVRKQIEFISYFGYMNNADKSPEQYFATQLMISELLGRKIHFTYNGLDYETRKANILTEISRYQNKPSFNNQTKTIKVGQEYRFKDANDALKYVAQINAPKGLSVRIEGNEVIVTATKEASNSAKIRFDNVKVTGTPLAYVNGNWQKIGVLPLSDPLSSFLNFQVLKNGNVKIIKEDAETGNKSQGKATLEGAKYGLYKEDGIKVAEVTLKNVNGKVQAEVKDLEPIKYYFQELLAPNGYTLSTNKLYVTIPAGETAVITAKDRVIKGNIHGYKVGNKELVATTNSDIKPKLAGVELQAKSKTTGKVVKTVTDKNGYFEFKGLAYDDYEISETKGMEGYQFIQPFTVTIETDGQILNYVLEDKIIEQKLKVVKVDQETGKTIALAGTQFKIWDKLANNGQGGYVSMALPNDTELSDVFTTNENGYFVTTDTLKYGQDRYELREIKAPEKYVLNITPYVFSVTNDTDTLQVIHFANRLAKANVEVFKYDTTTNFDQKTAIENVEFDLFKKDDQSTTLVGTFKTDKDGKINVNDLLVGDYIFKEVKALNGYLPLGKDVPFTITVSEDGKTIFLEAENKRIPPGIGTTAMGKYTNQQKVNPLKKVTITDVVKYSNLIVGKTYTVNGILMDKESSIQAGKDVPLLVNGKEVTASKVFIAEKPDGTISLDFFFDASALAGKETVVFENMYRDGRLIASHTDIHDKGQTVRIVKPTIQTRAIGENGKKQLQPLPNQKVIEIVQLNDLIVGQKYKLLVQGYITPDGVELEDTKIEKVFKADKTTLEFLFEYLIDGRKLEGKGLSFSERLEAQKERRNEKPNESDGVEEVTKHNVDLTNEEQTIYFVKVLTPKKTKISEMSKEVKYSAMLPQTGEHLISLLALKVLGILILFSALGGLYKNVEYKK